MPDLKNQSVVVVKDGSASPAQIEAGLRYGKKNASPDAEILARKGDHV